MEFVLDLPPPPFYTLYGPRDGSTSAATAVAPVPHDEGAQAGGAAGSGEGSAAAVDPAAASAGSVATALPPPPPPPTPIDGAFTVFGERHSTKVCPCATTMPAVPVSHGCMAGATRA